jgi:hypothetical protein
MLVMIPDEQFLHPLGAQLSIIQSTIASAMMAIL